MKYIKKVEELRLDYRSKNIYFTIDIENLTPNEIRLAIKKVAKMFPEYRISDDLEFLIDTDPKYLKTDYKKYKYIIVYDIYVYLDNKNGVWDSKEFPIINGNLFLLTNSIEELKINLETNKDMYKYNL